MGDIADINKWGKGSNLGALAFDPTWAGGLRGSPLDAAQETIGEKSAGKINALINSAKTNSQLIGDAIKKELRKSGHSSTVVDDTLAGIDFVTHDGYIGDNQSGDTAHINTQSDQTITRAQLDAAMRSGRYGNPGRRKYKY